MSNVQLVKLQARLAAAVYSARMLLVVSAVPACACRTGVHDFRGAEALGGLCSDMPDVVVNRVENPPLDLAVRRAMSRLACRMPTRYM